MRWVVSVSPLRLDDIKTSQPNSDSSLQPRVATDIRIGTRTDKEGSLEGKVATVEALLAFVWI